MPNVPSERKTVPTGNCRTIPSFQTVRFSCDCTWQKHLFRNNSIPLPKNPTPRYLPSIFHFHPSSFSSPQWKVIVRHRFSHLSHYLTTKISFKKITESQRSCLFNWNSKSSFRKLTSPPVYPASSCTDNKIQELCWVLRVSSHPQFIMRASVQAVFSVQEAYRVLRQTNSGPMKKHTWLSELTSLLNIKSGCHFLSPLVSRNTI